MSVKAEIYIFSISRGVCLASLALPGLMILAIGLSLGADDPKAEFSSLLAEADGPAKLDELRRWCTKNSLFEEKKIVQEILAKITPPAKPASDSAKRAKLREQRAAARKTVSDFMNSRSQIAADEVRKLISWMKEKSYGSNEARERVKELARKLMDADHAAGFNQEIDALPRSSDTTLAKQFKARLDGIIKGLTARLLFAVEKCLEANEPGLAFELFKQLIRVDPENERAHKALGHKKIDGRWLRPYHAEQYKAGIVWDDKWGWMLIDEKERYERGEYFDSDSRRWGKLADLNKDHADPNFPWRMISEHFELVSTADLHLTVQILKHLEAFFLQAFGEYDLFFSQKSSDEGAKLIFGVTPANKVLMVNFYRDEAQFRSHAKPPAKWAAGFYSPGKHASYFYAVKGQYSAEILQHELTHQILGEYSRGYPMSWLAEGAAVFLESAKFRDGVLTIGRLNQHPRVAEYSKMVMLGEKEHSLRAVLNFRNFGDWGEGEIPKNYRGAGAVVYFLLTMDEGRYRGDFLDLLRDSYNNKARSIEDYFGLSIESLTILMERFYRYCHHRDTGER